MAKLKYDHAVIYNGVFYPAGTEIVVKENKAGRGKNKEKADEKAEEEGDENDDGANGSPESGLE